jgi:hypothetical protein
MALTGKIIKERDSEGREHDVFSVKVTNGTFEQLKELSDFLKEEGLRIGEDPEEKATDAIKYAISFLVSIKDKKDKKE